MSVKSLKTGSRSISLLAGNTPEHHVLIAEQTVGAGGTASVTFSNIPADYQHLQIRYIGRITTTGTGNDNLRMQFNSDTGNNYTYHLLYGTGTSALSTAATSLSATAPSLVSTNGNLANTFAVGIVDILDYTSISKNRTVRALSGADYNANDTTGVVWFGSSAWLNATNAITSIKIFPNANNIAQYSSFALYGIK